VVQVLSTLAGGNGNLTTKVEENAMQMAKQGTLTALKLAKISAGEFVDAMRTMPEQDDIPGGVLKELFGDEFDSVFYPASFLGLVLPILRGEVLNIQGE